MPTLNNVTPAEILIAVILPCLTNRQTVAAEHPKTSLTRGNRAPASSGRAKNCVAWFVCIASPVKYGFNQIQGLSPCAPFTPEEHAVVVRNPQCERQVTTMSVDDYLTVLYFSLLSLFATRSSAGGIGCWSANISNSIELIWLLQESR